MKKITVANFPLDMVRFATDDRESTALDPYRADLIAEIQSIVRKPYRTTAIVNPGGSGTVAAFWADSDVQRTFEADNVRIVNIFIDMLTYEAKDIPPTCLEAFRALERDADADISALFYGTYDQNTIWFPAQHLIDMHGEEFTQRKLTQLLYALDVDLLQTHDWQVWHRLLFRNPEISSRTWPVVHHVHLSVTSLTLALGPQSDRQLAMLNSGNSVVQDAERQAISLGDTVVVYSNFYKDRLTSLLNPSDARKLQQAQLGREFPVQAASIERHAGRQSGSSITVAMTGRLCESKGWSDVLEVIKLSNERDLPIRWFINILIAPGVYSVDHEVIRELATFPNVILEDGLNRQSLQEVFAHADIVLMPSLYEPFGLVGLEAITAGAVLAVREGLGMDDYTEATSSYKYRSIHDLISMLERAVNDPIDLEQRRFESVAIARTWPDWLSSTKQFVDLYKDMIDTRARAGSVLPEVPSRNDLLFEKTTSPYIQNLKRVLEVAGHAVIHSSIASHMYQTTDLRPDALDVPEAYSPSLVHYTTQSLLSDERVRELLKAAEYIRKSGVLGDVVECGVYQGGASAILASAMALDEQPRHLWMYDTFTGMTAYSDIDDIQAVRKHHSVFDGLEEGELAVSVDRVRDLLYSTPLDPARMHFVEGDVRETLLDERNLPETIAILRLDTDYYDSTLAELKALYPRLVPGGLLILDDYGTFPGHKRAVDEYFESLGEFPYMHRTDYSGRCIVKR